MLTHLKILNMSFIVHEYCLGASANLILKITIPEAKEMKSDFMI